MTLHEQNEPKAKTQMMANDGKQEICTIGTFSSEEDLARWCEENKGRLAKEA